MAVYQLSAYPKTVKLSDTCTATLRPMVQDDAPALLEFFKRIADAERYFLKDGFRMP